ncbi:MAG: response regulator [Candidatus Omnitrophota bacterium]|nr:MAG: response regulator [Candidatus Omnitrophota bacterium]
MIQRKRNLKVLIVDNDDMLREILHFTLTRRGFIIEEAKNGKEALEKVNKSKPDLIILDIKMPIMNGFETYRHLRKNPDTKDIPIIFVSSNSTAGNIIRNIQEDLVEFIKKPYAINDLLEQIKRLLR